MYLNYKRCLFGDMILIVKFYGPHKEFLHYFWKGYISSKKS